MSATIPCDNEQESTVSPEEQSQLRDTILRSSKFQRASQLREILSFLLKYAAENPGTSPRELDIAVHALGRRPDFDPAYDNIVRVQVGHLRRRLHDFAETEGIGEPIVLTIPRGTYTPLFERRRQIEIPPSPVPVFKDEPTPDSVPSAVQFKNDPKADELPNRKDTVKGYVLSCFALLLGVAALYAFWATRRAAKEDNAFASVLVPFLQKHDKRVSVVLPDTSLLLVQKILGMDIPLETYTATSYVDEIARKSDTDQMKRALEFVARTKTSTLTETVAGTDLLQKLKDAGLRADLKYARDLHVSDLGQGNFILIGNQRSDPWVTLFSQRLNFNFESDNPGWSYGFVNRHPLAGEQQRYVPVETPRESVNYADVILTPNLTDTGSVILIIGSDVPANEAALRYLLEGDVPPNILQELRGPNVLSLEAFFKGHHLHGESNDQFALIASRIVHRH